jgi:hypothetical protein
MGQSWHRILVRDLSGKYSSSFRGRRLDPWWAKEGNEGGEDRREEAVFKTS